MFLKVMIISDTHGRTERAENVIENFKEIKHIIHLGDVVKDVKSLMKLFPDRIFNYVAGNNDFSGEAPFEKLISIGGKKFFITHGHRQRVNYSLLNLSLMAVEKEADAALFGHTHCPFYDESMGIAIFNPGSISLPRNTNFPTFGIVEITCNGRVLFDTYEFVSKDNFKKL
ncbi:MAG: metallophosphoesterase [Firmicutes bacterium]|nr:metallophosphoesterase [Bacillota bacterium]